MVVPQMHPDHPFLWHESQNSNTFSSQERPLDVFEEQEKLAAKSVGIRTIQFFPIGLI